MTSWNNIVQYWSYESMCFINIFSQGVHMDTKDTCEIDNYSQKEKKHKYPSQIASSSKWQ